MRPRSHRCLPPCHARRGREENPVMRTSMAFALILAVVLVLAPLTAAPVIAQGATPLRVVLPTDRTVLPISEPTYPHSTVFDVRNATPPPRFEVKAPANAPNVLVVLIDDMGFGQSSAFGGPISDADGGSPGQQRTALQRVPYHGALL